MSEAAAAEGTKDGAPDGSQLATNGLSGLSDDYQGNEALKDFSDVNGLAKAYLDTKSMVGKSLHVPGEDAGTDDWDKFYNTVGEKTGNRVMARPNEENAEAMKSVYDALGRPSEATGYEIPEVEGASMPEERGAMLKTLAHEAGLSKEQFNKVLGGVLQNDAVAEQQFDLEVKEGIQGLHTELGFAYDEKMRNAERIKDTFFDFIGTPLEQMGADSARAFIKLAEAFGGESNSFVSEKGEQQGALSPAQAQEKISEIMNNKDHAYWNPADPANNVARAKMRELHKQVAHSQRDDVITIGA